MQLYVYPPTAVSVASAPIEFILDGLSQTVTKNTSVPANSKGLPVEILNPSGIPTDIATETTLLSVDAELVALNAKDFSTETTLSAINTKTPALVTGRVPVDGSGVTQPISAASLPLPTGAATETTLSAADTKLGSIDTKTPALVSGRVPVDGSGVTQPVSAASLPLPTGAATEATLATRATEATLLEASTNLGDVTDAAVTNPASDASVVAALKGLLTLISAQTTEINKSVANGATQSNSTVSTSAANVAIPANTVGFIIQGFTGNAGLYWSLGGTAANDGTSGHKLEDSRDSGYIPYGGTGNLSVIGEAAGTRYQITWFTRS